MFINDLTFEEMKSYIEEIGEKKFRAQQLFTFFNKNKKWDLNSSSNLPKDLKSLPVREIKIFEEYHSKIDETVKFLFELNDGNLIEGVLLKYEHGYSQCISTQVGCRMGCSFCASTKGGLIRNLTPSEMAGQIYLVENKLGINISNIVLMGSGEPLDNYENVIKFFDIIHDENGKNLSNRSITISSCGIVPRIYDLEKLKKPINLAISLHSPFDEDRKKIMPITNRYSIEEVLAASKYYSEGTGTRITLEYTLIKDVNDREIDADELIRITKDIKVHVNLIPLNPIKEYNKGKTSPKGAKKFQNMLLKGGINATIRRELGSDISASCGQLRRKRLENENSKANW